MTDLLDNPFDPFADAVEESLRAMREEIRSLRAELETRSAPVIQPPVPVDVDGIRAGILLDVRAEVARAVAEIPAPKDGADGKDGVDGKDGANGIDGKDGANGERGADGLNGRDGSDGIATREELEALIEARFADVQVRTFADSYTGVYKPDTDYTRGVFATWGGSLFLAKADTRAKPGESPDWQLVVKRGADGRK